MAMQKTVLITGVSSGIGEATAIALAQAGFRVFGGARSPEKVRPLPGVNLIKIDVCNDEQVRHSVEGILGDLGEIAAVKALFGSDGEIAVSATKSATGHLLGAAGGLGAIFAILALKDQVAPPTLNLESPDPAGNGIDFVTKAARSIAMDYAIANGFGFGGVNASALFRRWTN